MQDYYVNSPDAVPAAVPAAALLVATEPPDAAMTGDVAPTGSCALTSRRTASRTASMRAGSMPTAASVDANGAPGSVGEMLDPDGVSVAMRRRRNSGNDERGPK